MKQVIPSLEGLGEVQVLIFLLVTFHWDLCGQNAGLLRGGEITYPDPLNIFVHSLCSPELGYFACAMQVCTLRS